MTRSRGFTLVELLVALFITAVMFAIGYGAINQAIGNREQIAEQQDRLLSLQRTMRVLAQDFTQLAPRPVRDPLGENNQPALIADGRDGSLVTLTRAGWANPAGVQRASMQRVRYVLDQGRLRREYWPVLDALLSVKPHGRELIDRVVSVKLRFLDEGRTTWHEQWPPPTIVVNKGSDRSRPIAVEVTLELQDYGKLVRLFEVAT